MTLSGLDPIGLIAECESKISSIDAEIATTQFPPVIATLQSLRASGRNKLGELNYLSSPLRVLPVEMLAGIFLFAVTAAYDPEDVIVPHAAVLSEVCHYWRQIALSLPSLWSALTIGVVDGPTEKYIDAIRVWLTRSLQLPLSIALISDLDEEEPGSAVINEIVGVKNRLESLTIAGSYSLAMTPLFADKLPVLQTLRLESGVDLSWLEEEAIEAIDLSAIAPHLRDVTFMEYLPGLHNNVSLPKLTHLEFSVDVDDILAILRQAQNLEQLRIHAFSLHFLDFDDNSDTFNQPQLEAVALPNLSHFTLISTTDETLALFQCLAFPALRSFSMDLESGGRSWVWDREKFAFFQGQSPHIQHVEFSNTSLSSADLEYLLRLSPELRSLTLNYCEGSIDDVLVNALEYDESNAQPLAPCLDVIAWRNSGFAKDAAIKRMLLSRCPAAGSSSKVARLKKVSIRRGLGPYSKVNDAAFIAQMEASLDQFHLS
ncbi:hypothetical protein B0H16DRAFT_1366962 [Mycena metata]|uniref:F-box domain-containing protein n=1 Tax=Mycena metata TaxID=1033252 RepID=A0AAD7NM55_9AGAR|nr:hypothetical protein B0H16DRAFT_1366962 [Mycena metata]